MAPAHRRDLRNMFSVLLTVSSMAAQVALAQASSPSSSIIPTSILAYTASYGYPTSAFPSYYPVPSGQEPQPALYDPVLNITFPLNLTNPDTIPTDDDDPIYLPQPIANLSVTEQKAVIANVVSEVLEIASSPYFTSNCSKCIAALSIGKSAALLAPTLVPAAMVTLCNATGLHSYSTCLEDFSATTFGAIWTQVVAFADVSGLDGQYICSSIGSFCPAPSTSPLNVSQWLSPKPKNITKPQASGQRVKVLHLSDFHLDPRYKVGAEGNCTSGFCCRSNGFNAGGKNASINVPAPLYGYFECDTPYDLGLAALQAVGPLTGTSKKSPLAWTIYTGDLVSHDPQSQLSRAYTEYAEASIYHMFRKYLSGPVFPVLGNHDSNPEAIDAPHSLPGPLGEQFSWNYNHVSALWKHEGWINDRTVKQARTHYGAYSVSHQQYPKLRLITFNSDFWYRSNFLNYINTSNPDVSGTFKFVIKELSAAERAGERVWLFAHVLSGWSGTNPLPNPTNLYYQIVDRYSATIANVFFGHTHEDQVMIYYANNGTNRSLSTAQVPGWIGPSVTPLNNLNSGLRMYEVDTGTFEIYEAYTWYADVSSFANLTTHGPVYKYEYSTRDAYGSAASWPTEAPLNATFWHAVTQAMEKNNSLVSQFNTYQGKSSIKSPNCTNSACAAAKVCYMRSGSTALGRQCPQGYDSVQSAFKPTT